MGAVKTAINACYGLETDLGKCNTSALIGEALPTSTTQTLKSITITPATAAIVATPNAVKGILDTETCTLTPTEIKTAAVPASGEGESAIPATPASARLTWAYSGPCLNNGYVKN